jgi:hypothetical protein
VAPTASSRWLRDNARPGQISDRRWMIRRAIAREQRPDCDQRRG